MDPSRSLCDSSRMSRRSRPLSLARIALAYLVALQALLGAWVGHAAAATDAFDPSLVLCRTASGEPQNQDTDRKGAVPLHCVVMCLNGACAGGDPPAMAGAAVEFQPLHGRTIFFVSVADADVTSPPYAGVNARGPPQVD